MDLSPLIPPPLIPQALFGDLHSAKGLAYLTGVEHSGLSNVELLQNVTASAYEIHREGAEDGADAALDIEMGFWMAVYAAHLVQSSGALGPSRISNTRQVYDCIKMTAALKREMPDGRVLYLSMLSKDKGGLHMAFYRKGWYYDYSLGWVLEQGYWTERELATRGLVPSALAGRFTEAEYQVYLSRFAQMPTIPPGE